MRKLIGVAALAVSFVAVGNESQGQTVRSAVGANAAAIQAAVDAFRTDLGVSNGVGPCAGPGCSPGVGRREINWDGVPDAAASPNAFPGNFFNLPSGNPAGRVRGIQFSTTGTFEVSANAASGVPVLFGNHSSENSDDFAAFSPERIFGMVGSTELDVTFNVPGSPGISALVRGFGAVFTDVELAGAVRLDYFDSNNVLIHSASAEAFPVGGAGDTFDSFSFVGVSFPNPVVNRVRITNGGYDLALTRFTVDDSVAMDDFIFGEPMAVPEPASGLLGVLGMLALLGRRRTRHA